MTEFNVNRLDTSGLSATIFVIAHSLLNADGAAVAVLAIDFWMDIAG